MREFYLDLSAEQAVLLISLIVFFVIQLVIYWMTFSRVAFYRHKGISLNEISQEGLSIIICAKNESENLEKNLPLLLEQGHPLFEVIVVNIESSDNSDDTLTILSQKYPNLVVRTVARNDGTFGNIKAIAWGLGIKAAKYDWIVITEAHCFPDNNNWLASIQKNFIKNHNVILGYTHYKYGKLTRADRFFNALFYLSRGLAHKPYTGSGENLTFRKSLFFEHKGFHPLLKPQDRVDRIFVNTIATKNNTVIDITHDTTNASSLKLSFRDWQQKKIKEFRSSRLFNTKPGISKQLEFITRILFYLLIPVTLYFVLDIQWAWITVASLFAVRLFTQIIIFYKAQKRLREPKLIFPLLIWDLLAPLVYLPLYLSAKFNRR